MIRPFPPAFLTLALGLSLTLPAYAGAPSPREAWERAREAYRRGDYRAHIEGVAPEGYDECICQLSSILAKAIGYEQLEPEEGDIKKLNRILGRFGVLEAEAPAFRADSLNAPGLWGREAIARIQNKPGLYHEVMRFLRKHKVGPELPSLFQLELGEVAVDGSTATGRLNGNPRLRPEARLVGFVRIGDAWYVNLPSICLDDLPEVDVP